MWILFPFVREADGSRICLEFGPVEIPNGILLKKATNFTYFYNSLRSIPDGDVFLHTGDFTYKKSKGLNQMEQVIQFNDWLGTLPHKHKIVIAGNHDFSFDSKLAWPHFLTIYNHVK